MPPPKPPDPSLVENVHRALRASNQSFSARLRASLAREGLPFSRFAILRLLIVCGPTTSRRLAQSLGVTTANMPKLVERLESDGLVRRARNREDRREILIESTPKGRRVFHRQKAVAARELVRAFDGWTNPELRELLRSLKRLTVSGRDGDLVELKVLP